MEAIDGSPPGIFASIEGKVPELGYVWFSKVGCLLGSFLLFWGPKKGPEFKELPHRYIDAQTHSQIDGCIDRLGR